MVGRSCNHDIGFSHRDIEHRTATTMDAHRSRDGRRLQRTRMVESEDDETFQFYQRREDNLSSLGRYWSYKPYICNKISNGTTGISLLHDMQQIYDLYDNSHNSINS